MTDYILFFRSTPDAQREHMGTPEKAQQSMQQWLTWIRDLEAKGKLASPGQPLDGGGAVVRGRERTVTDGPFIEAKDLVAGFTVIRAHDLAEASELAKGCPILDGGGSVEVRAVRAM